MVARGAFTETWPVPPFEYERETRAPMRESVMHTAITYTDFPFPPIGWSRVRGMGWNCLISGAACGADVDILSLLSSCVQAAWKVFARSSDRRLQWPLSTRLRHSR